MLAAILMVGIIGREFFNAFYVFRELLFVLGFAAVVVFFAAGIAVLGFVFHSAWQNLIIQVRKRTLELFCTTVCVVPPRVRLFHEVLMNAKTASGRRKPVGRSEENGGRQKALEGFLS